MPGIRSSWPLSLSAAKSGVDSIGETSTGGRNSRAGRPTASKAAAYTGSFSSPQSSSIASVGGESDPSLHRARFDTNDHYEQRQRYPCDHYLTSRIVEDGSSGGSACSIHWSGVGMELGIREPFGGKGGGRGHVEKRQSTRPSRVVRSRTAEDPGSDRWGVSGHLEGQLHSSKARGFLYHFT